MWLKFFVVLVALFCSANATMAYLNHSYPLMVLNIGLAMFNVWNLTNLVRLDK